MPVVFNARLAFSRWPSMPARTGISIGITNANGVQYRWCSMPARTDPRTSIGTNTGIGVMNANGVPQQRAGLPPQGGYYAITRDNSCQIINCCYAARRA
jgi:hypothetical protein